MNPPSMETIMLVLSGVVLASGVLYWLWSHIQLTQKKVQLLESAVFELRGMVSGSPSPVPVAEAPAAFNDVSDDWEPEAEAEAKVEQTSTPLEELEKEVSLAPQRETVVHEGQASLDSMPLKELRRLAEQRGIANTSEMRKKELLGLLRSQVTAPTEIEDVVDLE
jgi:hypothetical protein